MVCINACAGFYGTATKLSGDKRPNLIQNDIWKSVPELAFSHYDVDMQGSSNHVHTHRERASLLGVTVTSVEEE